MLALDGGADDGLGGLSRLLLGFASFSPPPAQRSCSLPAHWHDVPRSPHWPCCCARPRQRAGFLWSEARAVAAAGLLGGLGIGLLLAQELVKVLTGIFDPPPELIAVPWGFLTGTFAAVLLAAGVATALLERATSCVDASRLRG